VCQVSLLKAANPDCSGIRMYEGTFHVTLLTHMAETSSQVNLVTLESTSLTFRRSGVQSHATLGSAEKS
jgi:hypothetical protein